MNIFQIKRTKVVLYPLFLKLLQIVRSDGGITDLSHVLDQLCNQASVTLVELARLLKMMKIFKM